MIDKIKELIDKLEASGSLTLSEYEFLIANRNEEAAEFIRMRAVDV